VVGACRFFRRERPLWRSRPSPCAIALDRRCRIATYRAGPGNRDLIGGAPPSSPFGFSIVPFANRSKPQQTASGIGHCGRGESAADDRADATAPASRDRTKIDGHIGVGGSPRGILWKADSGRATIMCSKELNRWLRAREHKPVGRSGLCIGKPAESDFGSARLFSMHRVTSEVAA
jgi:hypothetical protein